MVHDTDVSCFLMCVTAEDNKKIKHSFPLSVINTSPYLHRWNRDTHIHVKVGVSMLLLDTGRKKEGRMEGERRKGNIGDILRI